MNFKSYPGPSAWNSGDYQDDHWVDVLTPSEAVELSESAEALSLDESDWLKLEKSDLGLPTLQPHLDAVTKELDQGRGFAVIRGIDLPPTDVDYAYRVNWILATALGNVIAQNSKGEVIGAVQKVVDANDNGLHARGYVSSAELRFHCDGGDVVSLLCVRQAPEGGESSLVSLVTIHNTMIEECPEHLETLYRGLALYMRKEGNLAGKSMPKRPIFYAQPDYLLGFINLRLMELPYEASGEPMPADERAAMDALEEIAEREENKLNFKLQPGDMLLTNNYVCMHKRSSFVDDPDPAKSRLMLRLWYNINGSRVEAIHKPDQRGGYFKQQPRVIRHRSC